MASRAFAWLRRNWKRLLLANAISYAAKGSLMAALMYVGLAALPALAISTVASWSLFFVQLAFAK